MNNSGEQCFYVTGTDTDVGKTIVSAALLKAFAGQGLSTLAMKPVASGCHRKNGELRNSDALLLKHNASLEIDYQSMNPFAFEPAIAPHIAAAEMGVILKVDELLQRASRVLARKADCTIIEGAGGWFVPLSDQETLADFAKGLACPVILVVGIRLGCINHALLSAEAIEASGLKLAGWVANCCVKNEPVQEQRSEDNIASIKAGIKAPLLATVPYLNQDTEQQKIDAATQYFMNLDSIA